MGSKREYSAEEKEAEAATIGYKVVGPLLETDKVFKSYAPVCAVVQIGSHQFKDGYYYGAGEENDNDAYGGSPASVMEESSSARDGFSGHYLPNYYPREDDRGGLRGVRDSNSIGASYDRYLRSMDINSLIFTISSCAHVLPLFSNHRLTFWLSNSIVLRAIISPVDKPELTISNGSSKEKNGGGMTNSAKSSPLRWKEMSPGGKDTSDWNDPRAFVSALEKVEAWIFSQTIQSICCQLVDVLLVLVLFWDAPSGIKASSHCRWDNSADARSHSVFVTEFGAVGVGVTLNTKAFQNAIFYLNSFPDKGGAKL
ncbi:hypothetical protein Tsubulata_004187 [Turnera subulata]|uniref:Uncharacterized protein n=1 Tax=Turnera subulata TaxID=218843 RepID=A0A9Q0GI31_9ROSI|nr:hypothetical protein Tsubulata_004187 [Turnera subulata]